MGAREARRDAFSAALVDICMMALRQGVSVNDVLACLSSMAGVVIAEVPDRDVRRRMEKACADAIPLAVQSVLASGVKAAPPDPANGN